MASIFFSRLHFKPTGSPDIGVKHVCSVWGRLLRDLQIVCRAVFLHFMLLTSNVCLELKNHNVPKCTIVQLCWHSWFVQFFIAELCCSVVPWVISLWMMSLICFIMYCVWSMEKISYISCFDLSWSGLALLPFCFDQNEYNKGTKRSDLWKLTDGVHDLNWIKGWIVQLSMLHWQQRHFFSTRPLLNLLGVGGEEGDSYLHDCLVTFVCNFSLQHHHTVLLDKSGLHWNLSFLPGMQLRLSMLVFGYLTECGAVLCFHGESKILFQMQKSSRVQAPFHVKVACVVHLSEGWANFWCISSTFSNFFCCQHTSVSQLSVHVGVQSGSMHWYWFSQIERSLTISLFL